MTIRTQFKNALLFVLLAVATQTVAQQVYINAGLVRTSFKENENSAGQNTLDASGFKKPETFMVEAGTRINIYKDRLKVNIGLQYTKHQINTSFYAGNTRVPTTYNLSYLGFKTGLTLDLLRYRGLSLQVHANISRDLLIFGTNKYQNVLVDLYKEQTFDMGLWNFQRAVGLEYKISDALSTSLNFSNVTNFKEENQETVPGEFVIINSNTITVGVLFTLPDDFYDFRNRLWYRYKK